MAASIVAQEDRIGGVWYENRVLLSADILVGDKVLTVFSTHFGRHADHEKALGVRAVIAEAKKTASLYAVLGDFNLTPDTPFYGELASHFTDAAEKICGSRLTFPSDAPHMTIDYIFSKIGVEVLSAQVLPDIVSDHRALSARISI